MKYMKCEMDRCNNVQCAFFLPTGCTRRFYVEISVPFLCPFSSILQLMSASTFSPYLATEMKQADYDSMQQHSDKRNPKIAVKRVLVAVKFIIISLLTVKLLRHIFFKAPVTLTLDFYRTHQTCHM